MQLESAFIGLGETESGQALITELQNVVHRPNNFLGVFLGVLSDMVGPLNPDGFHEVLTAYVDSRLPRRLRRHLGVSDVVQSVCCVAHARAGQFIGASPSEYRGWLIRIAENKIIDSLRRYRQRTCPPKFRAVVKAVTASEPISRTAESQVSLTEQALLLLSSIGSLPDDVRQVIVLRYTREMPFDQIAETLSMSETTVRRRWYEGIERLGSHLGVMAE